MNLTCKISGERFSLSPAELAFYERMGVAKPRLCPQERQRLRTQFRNFDNLYSRQCSGSGKRILSMYHEQQPFPVFDSEYWWSDRWDAKAFGRVYNFSLGFFEQYQALSNLVPRFAVSNVRSENCHYSNMTLDSRNCYLVFGCVRNEDCLYGHIVWACKNCVDTLYAYRCECCSACSDIVDCYNLHFSAECSNCQDSYFLHDCKGCQNCFGGVNLRNAQYHFCGQQLTKQAYQDKMQQLLPLSAAHRKSFDLWLEQQKATALYPAYFGLRNEDVQGNHLYESKDLLNCFDVKRGEHLAHCFTTEGQEYCQDLSFSAGTQSRFCFNCLGVTNGENNISCHNVVDCHDLAYSEFCTSSHDLIACNGLRNASYCILNRQYTREEYQTLRDRIVLALQEQGCFGEFFPHELSSFAHNESIAQQYQPLSKSQALERGLRWRDQIEEASACSDGPQRSVPDSILEVSDTCISAAFNCAKTGKAFRIIPQELEFYRKCRIAVPDCCPAERRRERLARRGARQTWSARCQTCGQGLQSAHDPGLGRQVLCEGCYLVSAFLFKKIAETDSTFEVGASAHQV